MKEIRDNMLGGVARMTTAYAKDSSELSWQMVQTGGFQSQVNVQPAPGVEGDFSAWSPRVTVNAGPGGLVAGPNGATVGRFAWWAGPADPDGTPTQVSTAFTGYQFLGNATPDMPIGFIHREQQALITQYLADATLVVPKGFPITVFSAGDFWAINRGTKAAVPGMKAYARFSDGAVQFDNAGSPITASAFTASIAPALATFTGSIANNVLTVTAVASGTLTPGMTLSGSGGGASIATNTTITAQLSGSAGAVGTYSLNLAGQNVPGSLVAPGSTITINGSAGLMNVTAVSSGTLGVGQIIAGTGGTGVFLGTTITALGTGAGGTGTYYVNPSQTAASTTMSGQGNIETKWIAKSGGAVGELVKLSSHLYG